jgi:Helicase conserved C-terminal domain
MSMTACPRFLRRVEVAPVLAGLVLLAAAMLKALEPASLSRSDFFSSRPARIAVIEFEILLGLSLLLQIRPWHIRRVALWTFSIFACVSAYHVLANDASCGCFGTLAVSPWISLAIDVAIFAMLACVANVGGRTSSRGDDELAALTRIPTAWSAFRIATALAAEGINLQFCNLIVNYDLPWNPQRIEQRIGRCHRYGQECDVVVVNFLNKSNAADLRVYQLLDEKFKLFSGVFGVSDEVLGAVESGVDFEKRIAAIYQKCRSPVQIEFEFDQLQRELDTDIIAGQRDAREKLLDNFDQEVIEKVRIQSEGFLNRFNERLWQITAIFRRRSRPTERLYSTSKTSDS